ncbi:monooxygenase 2-like [Vitis riparia]|uniref:monooxygenase 2-like n=1 Tax=Vitis riparia TaxID=96939 RepID=UPI00155A54FC|nr:monooxygenase 2-like [Vitis riparia]
MWSVVEWVGILTDLIIYVSICLQEALLLSIVMQKPWSRAEPHRLLSAITCPPSTLFRYFLLPQSSTGTTMEMNEDIIIVGAGIGGLTTCLGLHRLGLRSLVLESSDSLRVTGFALTTWKNAWRALDAVGVGDSIRQQHMQIQGLQVFSTISGQPTSEISFGGKWGIHEIRCVRRKVLLETLERELPRGSIRYSSKVVSIQESGYYKTVHLADGSVLKTKVLIGCDGVNSLVANWLGLDKPVDSGRSAVRGLVEFPDGHGLEPKFRQHFGNGVRHGVIPCGPTTLYWFLTFAPSVHGVDTEEMDQNPAKMKDFVLSKLGKVPQHIENVFEKTALDCMSCSPLKFRLPWKIATGHIYKGNVCVAGDALHPMTPDIGQGGCSAMEDGVVLARCLGEVLLRKPTREDGEGKDEECYKRISEGLEKYAKERRWRSFKLITTAYVVGLIQESDWKVVRFLRDKFLSGFLANLFLRMGDFDCGQLSIS